MSCRGHLPARAHPVTRTDLTLTNGYIYYFYVKAKNGAGLWSNVGVSDGIIANEVRRIRQRPGRQELPCRAGRYFEYSPDSRWIAYHTGEDYDYYANSACTSEADEYGGRWGTRLSEVGNSVAAGWIRQTNANVNPGSNIVYDIVSGGETGNCQYFALKDTVDDVESVANLHTAVGVDNSKEWLLQGGDEVTFRFSYKTYKTGLGQNKEVHYYASNSAGANTQQSELSPSDEGWSVEEITCTVPSPPSTPALVVPGITIKTFTGLGGSNAEAGIYVDNAEHDSR